MSSFSIDKGRAIALAERIRQGDRRAEDELVRHYQRPLRLILLKRLGDPDLVADLVQESLTVTIQRLRDGKVKKPESLTWFIRQTAVNLSIMHFRRARRDVPLSDEIMATQPAPIEKISDSLERRDLRDVLVSAMSALPMDRDRELLDRFYLRDEDKTAICASLDLTPAHFDRVLYRARQRMRKIVESDPALRRALALD